MSTTTRNFLLNRVYMCTVLLVVLLLVVLTMQRFGYKHTVVGHASDSNYAMEGNASHSTPTVKAALNDSKRPQRTFVYAIQTESCLPIHLEKALGNPTECDCDVLVLSYNQSCQAFFLRHVKYINGYSLTWPAGRNLLWQVAKSWRTRYLYYIFVDDDIVLKTTKSGNPWRQFERFLVNIEPAVAAVETNTNPYFPRRLKAIQHNKCVADYRREYVTTARFDEAFNAFHYQTLDYLFPYSTKHINKTWSYSGLHLAVKCEITFRGHAVLHTQITALNPSHRPYPRAYFEGKEMSMMLSEIAKEIPVKYRNNTVLLGWKTNGIYYESLSPTYCLPPPSPHMTIKPYALLEAPIPGL